MTSIFIPTSESGSVTEAYVNGRVAIPDAKVNNILTGLTVDSDSVDLSKALKIVGLTNSNTFSTANVQSSDFKYSLPPVAPTSGQALVATGIVGDTYPTQWQTVT